MDGLNLNEIDLSPLEILQLGVLFNQFLNDASDIVGVDLNDVLQGLGQDGEADGEADGEVDNGIDLGGIDLGGIDLGGIDLGGILDGLNLNGDDSPVDPNGIDLEDLNLDDDAAQDLLDSLDGLFGGFPDLLNVQ